MLSPASGSSLGRNDTRFVLGHKPNMKRCRRTFLPRRCQHDDPPRSTAPALESRPSELIKGQLFVHSSHLCCQRNGEHHEQAAINSRTPEDMAHIFISIEAHLRKPLPFEVTGCCQKSTETGPNPCFQPPRGSAFPCPLPSPGWEHRQPRGSPPPPPNTLHPISQRKPRCPPPPARRSPSPQSPHVPRDMSISSAPGCGPAAGLGPGCGSVTSMSSELAVPPPRAAQCACPECAGTAAAPHRTNPARHPAPERTALSGQPRTAPSSLRSPAASLGRL